MIVKNIKKCPFDDEAAKIFGAHNTFITNLVAEDGRNWYAIMREFAADTIKFAYDSSGKITSPGVKDVSSLTPVDMSVAEVDASLYPAECQADGTWIFDEETGTISQDAVAVAARVLARNTARRNEALRMCTDAAFPLQSAVAMGVATGAQQLSLSALQQYAIDLMSVDLTDVKLLLPVFPVDEKSL